MKRITWVVLGWMALLTAAHAKGPGQQDGPQDSVSPYRVTEGKNELLCRALVSRVNHYESRRPDTRCSTWDEIASYPKFTEPSWEELDPKRHEELLTKLMEYEHGEFFPPLPELAQRKRNSAYRELVENFIQSGGHLRVWRSRPALINEAAAGSPMIAPKEQTFVQFGTAPEQTALCVGTLHPAADWKAGTYVVMSDLSGPDINLVPAKPGTTNINALLVNTHGLFMYQGKPILAGDNDVWRFSFGTLERICNFEYVSGRQ
ncbi:MAG: hypothetical protein ACLPXB_04340 [Thiobacillaceae bacterium]